MTDFGVVRALIDFLRGRSQAKDEKKLQENFVAIVRGMRGNVYAPAFGSPEYWEAEKMADKGWFKRVQPFGYLRPTIFG